MCKKDRKQPLWMKTEEMKCSQLSKSTSKLTMTWLKTCQRGALEFRFCGFDYFLDRVFGFCAKKLCFYGFGVHCGLRIFRFLTFSFRFSRKILTGFRFFQFDLFGFRFLFDLSGNYAPPLISNSR